MPLHSPLSLLTSHFSFLFSPLSTLTSLYLVAALSFPPITIPKPSSSTPETKSSKLSKILLVVGCGLCQRGFMGCAVAREKLIEALAFLADASLWVVLWDCDLSLYPNWSAMGLWFVMWVCVLWWLWMRGFVVGRLLQAVVGVLLLVVGHWDGFNDPWVWWISVASVAVVWSDVVSSG